MKLATVEEIRAIDQLAITKFKIPESELMQRAGIGAAKEVLKKFPGAKKILVVCGKGKNGGDGGVLADFLKKEGRILSTEFSNVNSVDLIVDALFGIGLSRPVQGREKDLIEGINKSGKKIVSLDIPSGLSANTGRPLGVAVKADLTCTLGIPKVGLVIGDGPDYAGEIVSIDLGIPQAVLEELPIKGRLLEPADFHDFLMPRRLDTHKGTYGHFLMIGGSTNRLGAPLMGARAALRTGAGLVTVALPDRCYQKIPRGLMEVMYEPLPSSSIGRLTTSALKPLKKIIQDKDSVALGPGLGVTPHIKKIVREILKTCNSPLVLDADALNALGGDVAFLRKKRGGLVITPHPGEMGRLVGKPASQIQEDRLAVSTALARESQAIVVLKGARTLIVDPEGFYAVNPTGNPGMATAGMGDVLTGMIGALASQALASQALASQGNLLQSVWAAVYLHGLAGDRLKRRLGDRGLMASDLIEEIPLAFRELVHP